MNRFDWMRQIAGELGYEINSLRRWSNKVGFPLMGTAAQVKAWHRANVQQNGPPSKAERQQITQQDREAVRDAMVQELAGREPRAFKWFHEAAGEFVNACDWMFDSRPQSNGRELTEQEREFARLYIAESCALALLRCKPGHSFPDDRGEKLRLFYIDLLEWFDANLERFIAEHDDPAFANPRHPTNVYEEQVDAELGDESKPA